MPALSLLTKSATYTNGNPNDADEVELDLANAYANFASIQTDYNNLVTGAYTIAGVKTFSSTPKMDAIAPVTTNGATAITLAGAGVNAQTGTTYTVLTGDRNKLITFSNASAVAVTLPQAGTTGFANNFEFEVKNIGAGTVTITPTTSTIDGAATLTLTNGQSVRIYSDGTNYFSAKGKSDPSNITVYTGSNATEAEITFGTASTYRISGWIRVLTDARNMAVQFSDGTYKTASYRYSATGRNDSGTGTGGASTSAAAILINGDNTIGNASGEYLGVDITVTAKGSTDAIYSGLRGSITTVNTSGVNITNNVSGIYTGTLADMTKMKFFSETGGSANGNITYSLTVEEMA